MSMQIKTIRMQMTPASRIINNTRAVSPPTASGVFGTWPSGPGTSANRMSAKRVGNVAAAAPPRLILVRPRRRGSVAVRRRRRAVDGLAASLDLGELPGLILGLHGRSRPPILGRSDDVSLERIDRFGESRAGVLGSSAIPARTAVGAND